MRCFFFFPHQICSNLSNQQKLRKKGPPDQAEIMLKSPNASFVIKQNRHLMLSESTVKILV